jgi:hypothetical protein
MTRFLQNLWWFCYIYIFYSRSIPMKLSPQQLIDLQAKVDTLKTTVSADTDATAAIGEDQAQLDAAQDQLTADQAIAVCTSSAVDKAEADLVAFVDGLATPAA